MKIVIGLIEAYWNVNTPGCDASEWTAGGLIEAYWNVNGNDGVPDRIVMLRFNRSILKCK